MYTVFTVHCEDSAYLMLNWTIVPINYHNIDGLTASNRVLPKSFFTINLEQNLTLVSSISTFTDLTQLGRWNITASSLFIILLFLYLGTLVIPSPIYLLRYFSVKWNSNWQPLMSWFIFQWKHFPPDPLPVDQRLVTFCIAKICRKLSFLDMYLQLLWSF